MDHYQKVLAKLVSYAIRGQRPLETINDEINWGKLFEEAKMHDLYALLYPVIKELDTYSVPNYELMEEWKNAVLFAGMSSIQHMEEIKGVLGFFNKEGILVIALKGMVIRDLYPQPELRTMSDVDILIHEADINRAKNILFKMGYIEDGSDYKHIIFIHKSGFTIELHWRLTNGDNNGAIEYFEKKIWDSAVLIETNGVPVLSLSLEDSILYICLHMAEHMVAYGFGLRQLCDFALMVEHYKSKVDWNSFYDRGKSLGIERFILAVFLACRELLGLEVPHQINCQGLEGDSHLELFIDDIFSSGVHGHRGLERHIGNSLLRYSMSEDSDSCLQRLKYYLSFLFPPSQKLRKKYSYARKAPLLTPIAWVHRLINNAFRKDLVAVIKVVFWSKAKSDVIFKERTNLLRWLDLK